MKKALRTTRAVTYRRPGIPALILEGHWLTKKYRLSIGDIVDIDYQLKGISLSKNAPMSLKNQKRRTDKREARRIFQESNDDDEATNLAQRSDEVSKRQSTEHGH